MKLLLDENLSRRLVPLLADAYPGTSQVVLLGLESALDSVVWQTAKDQGFVIVTRDVDFAERSLVWGQPPKVIWLRTPNPSKGTTLKILLEHRPMIEEALLVNAQACVEVIASA